MKVLFLDIDGVCNSGKFAMAGNSLWNNIDPEACKIIKRIIKATGCEVVLSSTWRMFPVSVEVVKREVCPILDVTPNMQRGAKRSVVDRGHEVQAWLDLHPEATQYAILDDDSDFLPGQHLFKTSFSTGITDEIAQAVIQHLNS